jgi:hypothetical protein
MNARREALIALIDVFGDVSDEIAAQEDGERSYVAKRLVEILRAATESARQRMPDEAPEQSVAQEAPKIPLPIPSGLPMPTGPLQFDWTQFRLLTQMKVNADGRPIAHIGKAIGFTNLDSFLSGYRPTVTVDNVLRIMLWLGITDWRNFVLQK